MAEAPSTKLRLLCLVTSDPRTSARPAEAVRIVAGLGAWLPGQVALYLGPCAAIILEDHASLPLGEEEYRAYLPLLKQLSHPVYVPAGSEAARRSQPEIPCAGISEEELTRLASASLSVMRF